MTKAIGSSAAAILADRGQLDWDTPVDAILPKFRELQVLDGFSNGKPVLRSIHARPTLRQLTTHTSGLVYEFWNPDIGRYLHDLGRPSIISGLKRGLYYPLAFEPGTRWEYGGGIDWLGLAVSAIDGRPIDQFCKEEIFDRLGMSDTRFELERDMAARLGIALSRGQHAREFVATPMNLDPPSHPEFYGMGQALYSTAPDYMRFLRMWLNRGQLNGVRILKEDVADKFLQNHIGDLRLLPLKTVFPSATADLSLLSEYEKSHSLGFVRMEESVPQRRAAGSQFWGGVLNTHFWFDPANDIAGVLMTQLLPFLDGRFMEVFEEFERSVYSRYSKVPNDDYSRPFEERDSGLSP
jgi:CubicO group peptidase (beta-lactamase class C family)